MKSASVLIPIHRKHLSDSVSYLSLQGARTALLSLHCVGSHARSLGPSTPSRFPLHHPSPTWQKSVHCQPARDGQSGGGGKERFWWHRQRQYSHLVHRLVSCCLYMSVFTHHQYHYYPTKALNIILYRMCALHVGDNGPWEQKCQYAGSVGPFKGKWQSSRGI